MVWGAPTSCSSGGRSAVHTSSGTSAWWASTTAGWSSAAAVPLVDSTTAGRPGGQAEAEGHERGRALVVVDVEPQPGLGGQRQRQRRRPRAGRDDGVGDAGPHPLVDERGAERGGGGHGHAAYLGLGASCTPSARGAGAAPARARPRLHPDRPVLGRRSPATWPPTTRSCWSTRPATAARRAVRRRPRRRAPSCSAEAGGPGHLRRLLDGRPPRPARSPSPRPTLVDGLVLVGATAGIDDAAERAARRAADEALADRLERDGVDAFLDEWLASPLFAGAARPRPPGSATAGATPPPAWPRACAWPAPAPRPPLWDRLGRAGDARARAGRRARRQVHARSAERLAAAIGADADVRRRRRRRPRRPPRAAGRLPGAATRGSRTLRR